MRALLIALLLSLTTTSHAHEQADDTYTIDNAADGALTLDFPEDNGIIARKSAFIITSSVFLSNSSGERKATVTIKNSTQFQRLLDEEHLVAIFADGHRRHPLKADHKFAPSEEMTMMLDFGVYRYPILRLVTQPY